MRQISVLVVTAMLTMGLLTGCGGKGGPTVAKELPRPAAIPPAPPAQNVPIDQNLRQKAKDVIQAELSNVDPFVRAHAIEAIQKACPELADAIPGMLDDRQAVVRFAAAIAAGQLKLKSTQPALPGMLDDANGSVRVAAIFALHQLGDYQYSRRLEQLSQDDDAAVRSNVALALGLIGDPSGLKVLKAMQTDRNPAVRLQVMESRWRLKDDDALNDLIAAGMSAYPDDQMVAITALAAPRDTRVRGQLIGYLRSNYPEVVLVTAKSLGELGSDLGYTASRKWLTSGDPRQRSLAALALGAIGRADSQQDLSPLLKDSDADVRLSAGLALLQLKQLAEPKADSAGQ